MATITKAQIISEDGGLKLFQLLLPDLNMVGGKNTTNIDSPISSGKRCFSVFRGNGKYLFKDHYTKLSGDIFEMIAKMNKLESKKDFKTVLQIIQGLMDGNKIGRAHV